jgi:hypothetical protein
LRSNLPVDVRFGPKAIKMLGCRKVTLSAINITWRYSKKQHLLTRDKAQRIALRKGVPPIGSKKNFADGAGLSIAFSFVI